MDEIIGKIILAVIVIVVVPLLVWAVRWTVELLKAKAAQIDNETVRKTVLDAIDCVEQAVIYVMQTYVDGLKRSGSFTKEAQSEAYEKAKAKAYNLINQETQAIIESEYGDFNQWLDTKIEQTVRQTKKEE